MRNWIKSTVPTAAVAAALVITIGCKRQQVTSYEIPKEDYSVKPFAMPGMKAMMSAGNGSSEENERPEIKFTAPQGWQEKKGQMGAGAFHVEAEDGKYADIKVVPLRAGPEIEQQSVNMWREQLGLPNLPVDQVKGDLVTVGGAQGHLYDLKSDEPKFGKYKARTIAAVFEKGETLWFVKMDGEESVVSAQQQSFNDFLKSIRFEAPTPTQVASAAPAVGATASGNWPTPEGWSPKPPGPMVQAAYTTSKGAAVSVSVFNSETGGLLANVNRWRNQMKQGPIAAEDLAREVKTIDLSDGSKASAVDVAGTNPQTGKPGRLYGLIVTRSDGRTWFYKVTGDTDIVAAETAKLVEFAGTAH